MTSGHRDRLLLRFRNLAPKERGLLSNARCLGEGVDVPSIDGVAFIDPRRSTIDIVQALGRAIRKAPDKKLGTIVLPVFLSEDEDPDQVLDESAFKHVWDVLKALRAHDEALGEELDELRRRLGARRVTASASREDQAGRSRRPGRALSSSRPSTRGSSSRPPRRGSSTSACLERFVEREGHARVPSDGVRAAYRLGQWVMVQRRPHRGQNGTSAREAARMGWDAHEAAGRRARIVRFVEREGHAQVPEYTRDGFRLGQWVDVQACRRRKKMIETSGSA